jgi:Ubiquitin-conjugating enzyme
LADRFVPNASDEVYVTFDLLEHASKLRSIEVEAVCSRLRAYPSYVRAEVGSSVRSLRASGVWCFFTLPDEVVRAATKIVQIHLSSPTERFVRLYFGCPVTGTNNTIEISRLVFLATEPVAEATFHCPSRFLRTLVKLLELAPRFEVSTRAFEAVLKLFWESPKEKFLAELVVRCCTGIACRTLFADRMRARLREQCFSQDDNSMFCLVVRNSVTFPCPQLGAVLIDMLGLCDQLLASQVCGDLISQFGKALVASAPHGLPTTLSDVSAFARRHFALLLNHADNRNSEFLMRSFFAIDSRLGDELGGQVCQRVQEWMHAGEVTSAVVRALTLPLVEMREASHFLKQHEELVRTVIFREVSAARSSLVARLIAHRRDLLSWLLASGTFHELLELFFVGEFEDASLVKLCLRDSEAEAITVGVLVRKVASLDQLGDLDKVTQILLQESVNEVVSSGTLWQHEPVDAVCHQREIARVLMKNAAQPALPLVPATGIPNFVVDVVSDCPVVARCVRLLSTGSAVGSRQLAVQATSHPYNGFDIHPADRFERMLGLEGQPSTASHSFVLEFGRDVDLAKQAALCEKGHFSGSSMTRPIDGLFGIHAVGDNGDVSCLYNSSNGCLFTTFSGHESRARNIGPRLKPHDQLHIQVDREKSQISFSVALYDVEKHILRPVELIDSLNLVDMLGFDAVPVVLSLSMENAGDFVTSHCTCKSCAQIGSGVFSALRAVQPTPREILSLSPSIESQFTGRRAVLIDSRIPLSTAKLLTEQIGEVDAAFVSSHALRLLAHAGGQILPSVLHKMIELGKPADKQSRIIRVVAYLERMVGMTEVARAISEGSGAFSDAFLKLCVQFFGNSPKQSSVFHPNGSVARTLRGSKLSPFEAVSVAAGFEPAGAPMLTSDELCPTLNDLNSALLGICSTALVQFSGLELVSAALAHGVVADLFHQLHEVTAIPHAQPQRFRDFLSFEGVNGTGKSPRPERRQFWKQGTGFGTAADDVVEAGVAEAEGWSHEAYANRRRDTTRQTAMLMRLLLRIMIIAFGPCKADAELRQRVQREVTQLFGASCLVSVFESFLRNDSMMDIAGSAEAYEAVLDCLCYCSAKTPLAVVIDPLSLAGNGVAQKTAVEAAMVLLDSAHTAPANLLVGHPRGSLTIKGSEIRRARAQQASAARMRLQELLKDEESASPSFETFRLLGVLRVNAERALGFGRGKDSIPTELRQLCEVIVLRTTSAEHHLEANRSRVREGYLGSTSSGSFPVSASVPEQVFQASPPNYAEILRPLQFDEVAMVDDWPGAQYRHRYSQQIDRDSGQPSSDKMARLVGEVSSLSNSLPLGPDSSVFLRVDCDRLDVMKALISGPPGTPYALGLFLFDIYLPQDFPSVPPLVTLVTTGEQAFVILNHAFANQSQDMDRSASILTSTPTAKFAFLFLGHGREPSMRSGTKIDQRCCKCS